MNRIVILMGYVISLVLVTSCIAAGAVDVEAKEAMMAHLQTDEFTPEERAAVKSISVHNEEGKIWLVKGFTEDDKVIYSVSEHLAVEMVKILADVAIEHKYMNPEYRIEIWIKIETHDGTHKANPAEAFYDLALREVDVDLHGLGKVGEIR